MSKKIHFSISKKQRATSAKCPKQEKISLGEWVRRVLRRLSDQQSSKSPEERMSLIREAYKFSGPIGSIKEINKQITDGYLK